MTRRNMASWAIWTLLAFFLVTFGCSGPDHTETPVTDSGTLPDTLVADSGTPDTLVDTGSPVDSSTDAKCVVSQPCDKLGETCGDLECTPKGWQNMKGDTGTDSGAPDTFVADSGAETDPDTGSDSGLPDTGTPDSGPGDSGTPETTVDSGSSDSGSPDTGTPDSGPGDTGTPDTGFDAGPPKTLKCTTPVRITAFDSFTIGCPTCSVEDVGHVYCPTKDSCYVPVRNGGKATVMHWNGTTCSDEVIPGPPNWAVGISGTGEDSIRLAANDLSNGSLRIKTGGVWVLDSTQPAAKRFNDITVVSATEMYLLGNDPSWAITIWKGNGSAWTALPKLPSADWFSAVQLYADGLGRVAVGGYDVDSTTSAPKRVAVYVYDGTSWAKISSPVAEDFVIGGQIHGSSMNELWIGGATSTPQGKVCKLNSLSAWTCYVSSGTTSATKSDIFGPVYSPWTGAVVTGGNILPINLGTARMMTFDLLTSSPVANTIDSKARSADSIGHATGSNAYYMIHSGKAGEPAGFYRFTCD